MANIRRRLKHPTTLVERLQHWAGIYRREAETLPEGPDRSVLLHKAQQCDCAADLDGWLRSKELIPPN